MPKWREKLGKFLGPRISVPVAVLLVVIFASAALMISSYQSKQKTYAAAVNCYWLGTTSTSWNNAANWSSSSGGAASTCDGGVVPGSDDTAIFTSLGNNAANVDVNVSVRGININSGYTNTISQDAGKTVDIGINGFIEADGTYSATESMTISSGGANAFNKSGGTFNEGTGTVTFAVGLGTYNVDVTETLYNVVINLSNLNYLTITAGDTMVVSNTLTLTDGGVSTGTIDAQGNITQASTFDGSTATLDFGNNGVGQTYTINGGIGPILRFDNASDASDNVTFSVDGSLYGLNIAAGFGANAVPMTYNGHNLTLTGSGFTQAAGTFTASTTLTLSSSTTNGFTKSGGTFDEGTNAVVYSGSGLITYNVDVTETFYNVTINMTAANYVSVTSGDTMVVTNTLTLTDGGINTGTIDTRGSTNQAATFDGGSATLDFGDNGVGQTYTINGGIGPILHFDNAADATDNVTFSVDGGLYGLNIAAGFGANAVPMTYNGHNLTLTSGGYTQAAGTFTAPTTLTLNNLSGSNAFIKTGGTFDEGTGTVIFSGGASSNYDVDVTETFYNVTIDMFNVISWYLFIASGDTMVVTNTLTLTRGIVNTGTIDTRGNTNQAATFEGGTATLDFGNNGVGQTYTINGGTGPLLRFDNAADASDNVTFSADGSLYGLDITAGFGANAVPMTYNGHNLTLGYGGYNQAAGTFTAPATLTINASNSGSNVFIKSGGTFDEGTGTVVFAWGSGIYNVDVSEAFYNVTINMFNVIDRDLSITAGDTLLVTHNLILTRGYVNTGTLEAQGDVTVGASFPGGSAPLKFTGGNTQSFDLTGGTGNFNADITVNKSGGQVNLLSALVEDAANQDLTIQEGVFDINNNALTVNGSTGKLIVEDGGTLQLRGGETITANATYPQLDSGSTVKYDGTAGPYTLKNYTYHHLTIDGTGATFNLPAALVANGNLNIVNGTLDVTNNNYGVSVAGSWSNTGSFTAQSGTVTLNGTNQAVNGSTIFNNLSKADSTNNSTDVILTFQAGQTQTIAGLLTFDGLDNDDRVNLVSSAPGNYWYLTANGTFAIDYVDVTDSNAGGGLTIANTFSVNGGHNINWQFVPGAPTIGTATAGAGVGQATVTFTPPADDGIPITGYTVTSTPGSFTGTGAGSPITVNGLANGTAYTFTVHATNANGDGPESAASNSITTFAVPGAPTIGVATAGAGVGQATVTFTPPVSDGGTPITGYTVTSTPGSFTGTGAGSPITVSGLANGTAYTFKVYATNIVGNGAESAASNSVTTFAIPGTPTIGVATAGNAQASVTFTPPVSDGGTPITGYTVTSTPGSLTGTGAGSPITVNGLTNGTSYTFTVHATNIVGNSAESVASNAVTPSTVPGAPTGILAVAGNGQAQVTFTTPSDGGLPITGYTVTSTPGGITASGTLSPILVTSLTNGTSYTFTVYATNANGNGSGSAPSNAVTPTPPATSCNNNGLEDNGETGIDCGGGNCLACQELRLHITSPKLNETYYLGGPLPIKWKIGFGGNTATYSNSPNVITQLEISTDGGKTYRFIKNLLPANISPKGSTYLTNHSGEPYDSYQAVGIVGLQGSYYLYNWQLPIDQTLTGDKIKIRLTPKVYDSGPPITLESSRNFTITGTSSVRLGINPDEATIVPGGKIRYIAKVYDQDGHDITSSCSVNWSMQIPAAGSIKSNGLMAATSSLGTWSDAVKGQANCAGLTDFGLATFVTTTEQRRLVYAWTNPWSAIVKEPVRSVTFSVWGYDQFGLRLFSANYSFSLLDSRIGSITQNGRVANIATSNNWGCYPNKIKGIASYDGVEKLAFGSVAIYPANYAFGSSSSSCSDGTGFSDKILARLTGAGRAYAAEGQIFTSMSYGAEKYFRPGQTGTFIGVPRDQFTTPIDGVNVRYNLLNASAGALAKDGKFIATTNLGNYPKAIEIKANLGDTTVSKTFDVIVTNEKRKATTIMAWGPTGATELTSNRTLKMWKGSGYSFYSQLKDQFGDVIASTPFAKVEDISGKNLVNVLGPTTLSANNTQGIFKNAIKVTYDIDKINQSIVYENEKIEGVSPALYLTLDINAKNDDPAACFYEPHKICDPLDSDCVAAGVGNGGIRSWFQDGVGFLVNLLGDRQLKAASITALAITALISLILALLNLLTNLLPLIKPKQLFSMFVKSKDRKYARGLIYEAASGLPIPNIKVLLFRAKDQKLQIAAFSNNEGKFALAIPPNEEYYIEINSQSFDQIKQNRFQLLQKSGLKYSNNYFGERFSGRDTVYYFDRPIPLIANANAFLQARSIHKIELVSKILRIFNIPLLLVGFSFALVVFSSNRSLLNSTVVGLYVMILIYHTVAYFVIQGRDYGLVYKKIDNSPIDLAIVRAISQSNGGLVKTTVSDQRGRFALALPKGYYNIVVTKASLQQERVVKVRIKSVFSPVKENIALSEVSLESQLDRPTTTVLEIGSGETSRRVSLDSAEIIKKYNQKTDAKEMQSPPISS